ncbi:hypothetical protein [Spirosoma spitsbergense]|uniref:hypothetical protein n=1 Tax=Spirosoma spitsbergense TaxID=431554 RepID=UPI0003A5C91E|nr:hypothetical protein [Spirosoma spitsbergense]
MNRIASILLLFCLFTPALINAQDNIVLKSGTEIKAKVLEVSATEIKYRKQDNPDGPIYTSGVDDVLLINYANGTKDILGNAPSAVVQPSTPLLSSSQPLRSVAGLRYDGGWFSRHFSTQQGEVIPNRQVRSLLVTNQQALHSFEQGQHLRRWTYVTAGAAIALLGTGAALAAFGDGRFGHDGNRMNNNDPNVGSTTDMDGNRFRHRGDGATIAGVAVAGTGLILGVTALILDHGGTVAFRRAANRYRSQPATSLHLTPGYRGTGLGLSLRF